MKNSVLYRKKKRQWPSKRIKSKLQRCIVNVKQLKVSSCKWSCSISRIFCVRQALYCRHFSAFTHFNWLWIELSKVAGETKRITCEFDAITCRSHAEKDSSATPAATSHLSTSCLLLSQLHACTHSLEPDNSIQKCSTFHFVWIECKSVPYACSSIQSEARIIIITFSLDKDRLSFTPLPAHTIPFNTQHTRSFLHEPLLHIKKTSDTTQKSHSVFKRIYSPVVAALLRAEVVSFTSLRLSSASIGIASKTQKKIFGKQKRRREM